MIKKLTRLFKSMKWSFEVPTRTAGLFSATATIDAVGKLQSPWIVRELDLQTKYIAAFKWIIENEIKFHPFLDVAMRRALIKRGLPI